LQKEVIYMSKGITFTDTDKDKELIEKIVKFQHAQELPSFVEAVRRLCENGLSMNTVVKNLK